MILSDFLNNLINDRRMKSETRVQESKVMTAEECAFLIIKAVKKRDRLLITSLRGKLGRWMKLIAPSLVDKIAAKAIKDAR